jgi:hypothetical protein
MIVNALNVRTFVLVEKNTFHIFIDDIQLATVFKNFCNWRMVGKLNLYQ